MSPSQIAAKHISNPDMSSEALAECASKAALDRKALDVLVIDVRTRVSYTDFVVLASGTSDRHVAAVAEVVEHAIKEAGTTVIGTEGAREGQWALIDAGHIVVHVFHQDIRPSYDLETLFQEAPKTRPKTHVESVQKR